jgi:hypothetical protein
MPPALSPGRTVTPGGRPRDRLGRIVGLDVGRALAVFGMLVRTWASSRRTSGRHPPPGSVSSTAGRRSSSPSSLDYTTNHAWLVFVVVTTAAATLWRLFLGKGPSSDS